MVASFQCKRTSSRKKALGVLRFFNVSLCSLAGITSTLGDLVSCMLVTFLATVSGELAKAMWFIQLKFSNVVIFFHLNTALKYPFSSSAI